MTIALPSLIKKARQQLGDLVGLEVASTVSVRKDEPNWWLQVEVVEKRSIPPSQDILATYELMIDESGDVQNFARVGMRRRMDVSASVGAESGV